MAQTTFVHRILLNAPAILQDACKGQGNRPGRLRQRRLDSRPDLGHTALPLPSTGGVRGGPNPASFHSERSPHPMPDVTTAVPNSHLAPYAARGLKCRILYGVHTTAN